MLGKGLRNVPGLDMFQASCKESCFFNPEDDHG